MRQLMTTRLWRIAVERKNMASWQHLADAANTWVSERASHVWLLENSLDEHSDESGCGMDPYSVILQQMDHRRLCRTRHAGRHCST